MRIGRTRIVSFFFYFGYVFLYAPIFFLILYSFNASSTVAWQGFSLQWYTQLFSDEQLLSSIGVSVKVALCSATFAIFFGTLCAYGWERPPRRSSLGILATIPLVVPEIVLGLALLVALVWMEQTFGWPRKGIGTIILAHSVLGTAYVTAIVRACLADLDPILEEAALDLGASPFRVFTRITFPLVLPAILSGWLLAFILSFDDVILASFTSGPGASTLPLMICSSLKLGSTPQINALGSCVVLLATIIVASAQYILQKRKIL